MVRIVFFEQPDVSAGIPGGKIGVLELGFLLDPEDRESARLVLESALADIHGGEIRGEFETDDNTDEPDTDNGMEYGPWGVPL